MSWTSPPDVFNSLKQLKQDLYLILEIPQIYILGIERDNSHLSCDWKSNFSLGKFCLSNVFSNNKTKASLLIEATYGNLYTCLPEALLFFLYGTTTCSSILTIHISSLTGLSASSHSFLNTYSVRGPELLFLKTWSDLSKHISPFTQKSFMFSFLFTKWSLKFSVLQSKLLTHRSSFISIHQPLL